MANQDELILIMGASGTIGRVLADELEAAGSRIRAAYHSPEKARESRETGREAVVLELEDDATLRAALDGVGSLFLLTAEGPDQPRQELAMVRAAQAASVRRVVKLSVWRADEELTPIARLHRPAEQALEASACSWTFLRPTTLMQNFLGAAEQIGSGVLAQPASEAPVAFIDSRDVALVAAAVLTGDDHDGRSYPLTGPEALTYRQAADTFARVLGRSVEYVGRSDQETRADLEARGMPGRLIEMIVEVSAAYRNGGRDEVSTAVEEVTGTSPRSLEQFAIDHREVFG